MGTVGVGPPVPVQVQCERFYVKPYNPLVHVLVPVPVPVPVPETASVIKPKVVDGEAETLTAIWLWFLSVNEEVIVGS